MLKIGSECRSSSCVLHLISVWVCQLLSVLQWNPRACLLVMTSLGSDRPQEFLQTYGRARVWMKRPRMHMAAEHADMDTNVSELQGTWTSEDAHKHEAMVGCKNECRSKREHTNARQSVRMGGGLYEWAVECMNEWWSIQMSGRVYEWG